MKLNEVLKTELEKIRPSSTDISFLESTATDFISLLKGARLKAYLGGSLAKGTLTRGEKKPDIDIFVVFETEEKTFGLGDILGKIKLPGKLKLVHGSRDYYRIDCEDFILEVIPVVKVIDPLDAVNVTDVSLRHVAYVRDAIERDSALGDQIRLAKAFTRANRIYGAESYIHGFSGYSLEVLVIHYGSFVKFLKGLKSGGVIDTLSQHRNKTEVLREINKAKTKGPIVVVDPTFKYRNISAGLGQKTFDEFRLVAEEFLKNPSLDFFEKKELDVGSLKEFASRKGARFIELKLSTDRQEGDIAGTKMKKFLDYLVSEFNRKGQEILKVEFDYPGVLQNANGYIIVVEKNEVEIRGPSVDMTEAVKKFKKAHKGYTMRKGVLYFNKAVSVDELVKTASLKVGVEMGASGKIIN